MNVSLYRAALVLILCLGGGCATQPPAAITPPSPAIPVDVVKVGQKVTLVIESDGTPPLEYYWEKDGKPIPGATEPTLVLNNVQVSDSGVYVGIVKNSVGAAGEPYHLRVVAP